MNLGVHRAFHQTAFDTASGKARYFEHMEKELNLTPAQSEQMRSVLDDGTSVGQIKRITSVFSFCAPEEFFAGNIRANGVW